MFFGSLFCLHARLDRHRHNTVLGKTWTAIIFRHRPKDLIDGVQNALPELFNQSERVKQGSIPHNPNSLGLIRELELGEISVVIVAHGDRGGPVLAQGEQRNQTLLHHRARLATANLFKSVEAGVLKGSPTFEDALAKAQSTRPKAIVIYPFFMAEGYFVKKILPQRLAEFSLTIPHVTLQPLGLDANLVALVVADALQHASNAQIVAKDARLLVVGHGSKFGPASADATRAVMHAIKDKHSALFAEIDVAFLEETPFLAEQLTTSQDVKTPRATIISGFFNGDGLHAGEDVPNAMQDTASPVIYTGPIGRAPAVSQLITTAILNATKNS